MKIKFYKSNELVKPFRLSVHKSGKLGFTIEAAKSLGLTNDKSIFIGANEEDPEDKRLYMVINDGMEPGAFKVAKAGEYYYLPIKLLLDNLGIPYETENIVYSMDRVVDGEATYYRLTRVVDRKKPAKANETETEQEAEA